MSITKERTNELVEEFGGKESNSGAVEAQVAIFSERIRNITEHLKINKKDHAGRRGLIQLVSKRRRLLNYIKKRDPKGFAELKVRLGIRK